MTRITDRSTPPYGTLGREFTEFLRETRPELLSPYRERRPTRGAIAALVAALVGAAAITLVAAGHAFAAPTAPELRMAQGPRAQGANTEAPFLAENDAAMDKMMQDMAVKPSGDIDRDFVAMMVPHHQGAIDMAQALLRYGHNERLRRLAQEIIVTQQQEIAAMRLAVGERLPPSIPAPDQPTASSNSPPQNAPASPPMSPHAMHMHQEP